MHIDLAGDRPRLVIRQIQVDGVEIPDEFKELLQLRVNEMVERQRFPIKFKLFELKEGSALVSVERS